MQLTLPSLAVLSCLVAAAQAFLVPFSVAPKPPTCMATTTRLPPLASSAPPAAEAAMLSRNPLAGRKIQFSDNEDSDERVTQVLMNPDGTLSMLMDSTNAVAIQGNWKPGVRWRRWRR
jgi:hypothetical protein